MIATDYSKQFGVVTPAPKDQKQAPRRDKKAKAKEKRNPGTRLAGLLAEALANPEADK
jgi:hypothetical protein